MDLQVRCPSCDKMLKLPDKLAGKKVRCTACQEIVEVPGGAITAKAPAPKNAVTSRPPAAKASLRSSRSDPDDDDRDDDRDRPRRAGAKRGRKDESDEGGGMGAGLWIAIGGGGVALVAVVVIVVIMLTRSPTPQPIPPPPGGPMAMGMPGPGMGGMQPPNQQPNAGNNPAVNNPANPAPSGLPVGPVPSDIANETTQKVKQATVMILVTEVNGGGGSGSGFFALESGLVVTNAHVVGMKSSKTKPKTLEVIVNSGEVNEFKLPGTVLGVDQLNDLAVIQVPTASGKPLPAPLLHDTSMKLSELQKVYIFGFPLGAALGKNITVSASSVSALRKEQGVLTHIQVNGGMQPGNSGGPVVDARGVVIGVAVAGIPGTQINFAVPADYITMLANGQADDAELGAAFRAAGTVKVPVKVLCTDPMRRIKTVEVDVWTAPLGPPRPPALAAPATQSGDANKKTVALTYKDGVATAEIDVPAAAAGHALWLQPVVTGASGTKLWAPGLAYAPETTAPLDRLAATILLSNEQRPERTLHAKVTKKVKLIKANQFLTISEITDAALLETMKPEPRGVSVGLHPGKIQQGFQIFDKTVQIPNGDVIPLLVERLLFTFLMSPQGALKKRGHPGQIAGLHPLIKPEVEELFGNVANCYEATTLSPPPGKLNPGDTWNARVPLLMTIRFGPTLAQSKKEVVDLHLVCTYEGRRNTDGRDLGYVRVNGEVRGRKPGAEKLDLFVSGGRVRGYLLFDVGLGFNSQTVITIQTDLAIGDAIAQLTTEMRLTRQSGNPMNIAKVDPGAQLPQIKGLPEGPAGPAVAVKKGKQVLKADATIATTDPTEGNVFGRYKEHKIKLTAGVTYVIEMNSANAKVLDPYLRLLDPDGTNIAEDDDSGGNLNARIIFVAQKTGTYRIVAAALEPQQTGPYTLIVSEAANQAPAKKGPMKK